MVDKQEMMKENFKKKGLPELLSEVNVSSLMLKIEEELPRTQLKKFIAAVKRTFKKEYLNQQGMEARMEYLASINNSDSMYQVEFKKIEMRTDEFLEDMKFNNYVRDLLFRCQPQNIRAKKIKEKQMMAKVIVRNGSKTTEGYTFLDGEIGSTYHRTTRAFSGSKPYGYIPVFDICSLIAEMVAIQSLLDFSERNKELVQYLFVEHFIDSSNMKQNSNLPISETFKKDFMAVVNRYEFPLYRPTESEMVERHAEDFYLTKDSIGNSRGILNDFLLRRVVKAFIQHSHEVRQKTNDEYRMRSDYAKAFQTKKHIKKTHQERMKHNSFLDYFGFVELDNDVCLEKFSIIEENFQELCKTMTVPKRKDYQFRIKKLGKHRAAGLFYPYFKTTIFDLNHPNAFVHELWHQIDHILGESKREDYYSETINFRPFLREYKELIIEKIRKLPMDDPFKQQWNGTSKFNKSYYFTPTEVFARCGEIYIAEKGLNNSLHKTKEELQNEVVYPLDNAFIERVTRCFDKLSEEVAYAHSIEIPEENRKIEETVASNASDSLVEPSVIEQLQLFK